jgi:undecaprenyl-diphosphatase
LLYSILLGIVQGVTEWLPVSSKTQVLFVSNYLFSLPVSVAFAFGLFMEIGSIGSATIYFRRDIFTLLRDRRLLVYLVVVTVVTGLVGVPLYLLSERLLQGAYNLGIPMVVLGVFLVADAMYIRSSRRSPRMGGLPELGIKHYVVIGLAQGLSALPGVSRSGMTVSTMLFMGVDPRDAFRLSYLAYIPAALGGFATTLLFSGGEIGTALEAVDPLGVAIAAATALVIGLLVISALLRFAKRNDIYIVTLAVGMIALAVGALSALGSA